MLDKKAVARAQLGTALALFLQDLDPISVHTLACAGGEIAEHLASKAGKRPFALHAMDTFPDLTKAELNGLRRQFYNAFKHANDRKGQERSDDKLLGRFTDEQNMSALFVGWYDYAAAVPSLPIEAQVFLAWYFVVFPEKLGSEYDHESIRALFPRFDAKDLASRKAALVEAIAIGSSYGDVMNDPRTERRPLILAA